MVVRFVALDQLSRQGGSRGDVGVQIRRQAAPHMYLPRESKYTYKRLIVRYHVTFIFSGCAGDGGHTLPEDGWTGRALKNDYAFRVETAVRRTRRPRESATLS